MNAGQPSTGDDRALFGIPRAQWSCSPGAARSWLAYASYVSERHRFVYVETPKVACTSIKEWIHALEGFPPLRYLPQFAESKPEMLIHLRANVPLPSLNKLAQAKRLDTLQAALHSDDYFRFAIVRNPYSRLLAAWYNKLWLGEPPQLAQRAALMRNLDLALPWEALKRAHFKAFIRRLAQQTPSEKMNHHWRPQVQLLNPQALRYHSLLHIESLDAGLRPLRDWLNARGADGERKLSRGNESIGLIDRASYFDDEVIALIQQVYRADFSAFDYPIDSWTQIPGQTGVVDLDRNQAWERDIVKRNEFLALIYAHYRNADSAAPSAPGAALSPPGQRRHLPVAARPRRSRETR